MFVIGDKVVYPMHGAGIIEAIEEHEVLGELQQYYILTMPYGNMRVMIPLQNVDHVGLREIVGDTEVSEVAKVLQTLPAKSSANWNRRFNIHLAKIKSGSILEVAEVVRNLMLQDKVKRLSAGERRLLDQARQILISELVIACNKDSHSIEEWISQLLEDNTAAGI